MALVNEPAGCPARFKAEHDRRNKEAVILLAQGVLALPEFKTLPIELQLRWIAKAMRVL